MTRFSQLIAALATSRPLKLPLFVILFLSFPLAHSTESDSGEIEQVLPQILQVDDGIFLGLSPRTKDLEGRLNEFQLVIDLRYPYEGVYDELAKLRNSETRELNIPTSSGTIEDVNVLALEQALAENPAKRILIHDSNGHRSAKLWAAHVIRTGGNVEGVLEKFEPFLETDELRRRLERYRLELAAAISNGANTGSQ